MKGRRIDKIKINPKQHGLDVHTFIVTHNCRLILDNGPLDTQISAKQEGVKKKEEKNHIESTTTLEKFSSNNKEQGYISQRLHGSQP